MKDEDIWMLDAGSASISKRRVARACIDRTARGSPIWMKNDSGGGHLGHLRATGASGPLGKTARQTVAALSYNLNPKNFAILTLSNPKP